MASPPTTAKSSLADTAVPANPHAYMVMRTAMTYFASFLIITLVFIILCSFCYYRLLWCIGTVMVHSNDLLLIHDCLNLFKRPDRLVTIPTDIQYLSREGLSAA